MEKWKEVYTEEQLRKVQAIELKNLDVLTEVCRKIGVEFIVYGGTLIGAVRHKGFIPWDDDLDVAMPRKDYETFLREAPRHLPEEYVLQTPYTDKRTPYPYTKLRLKGTTYIEYLHHRLDIEQGIYVDIYPIDELPDSDDEYYTQYKAFHRLAVLYAWRQCPYLEQRGRSASVLIKKAVKFAVSAALKLVPRKALVRRMDVIAARYNGRGTSRMGNLYFPRPVNVFYGFYPLQDGEFHGRSVKLPCCWDQHLTSRYGDYMQWPPEEKRIGHRPYKLDFGDGATEE